ncbi:MAG: lysophospholipid acyltransferase family protein [Rhodocyclaceae bacterium]|nr:lysophospholipid acyltransferase family protein [Rhodocyclaceae bacterium]MDP1957066.1 lysophospholipid acyltransferase family protein [Rhodocyclaceae bacterium]
MLTTLRAGVRLTRLALHLLTGLTTAAAVYQWISPTRRLMLKQRWSRQLLGCLGVKLQVRGTAAEGLLVANHISFLDIYVINAVAPAAFVAKDEVRRWPLIGWLATQTDTIFLERGNRKAAQHARTRIVEQLHTGQRVAVFPEGTTTRGDRVLPFHGALFQAAIDTGAPVTPLALCYLDRDGRRSEAPAYADAITLWQALRAIVSANGLVARIEVLPPLPSHSSDRHHLAAHAHRAITHAASAP